MPLVEQADVVFHLAAAVGVKLVVEAPIHTIHTNVHGTETVLKAAARFGKRVLVASTSEVYGKGHALPFREDADLVLGPPDKTRWGYATSKLLDEFLALAYARERDLPVTVVRLFNTVGPRQSSRYGMVHAEFRALGARGRSHHHPRRRLANAQLHLGRRRRVGDDGARQRAARVRSGLQHRQRSGDLDSRSRHQGVAR